MPGTQHGLKRAAQTSPANTEFSRPLSKIRRAESRGLAVAEQSDRGFISAFPVLLPPPNL